MSPSPPGRLARLADLAFRRRRAVVAVWVVGLVAAFAAAGLAGDWSADYSTPGSESRAAAQLLQERFPERNPETVDVVWQAPDGAGSAGVAQRIDRLATEADALEGIGRGAPRRRRRDLARRHDRRAADPAHRAPRRDPARRAASA